MNRRLYTVSQANATLPYVSRIVEDITRSYGEWRSLVREFEVATLSSRADAPDERAEQVQSRAEEYSREIDGYVRELAALDVECKDPGIGLVDFPAMIDGEQGWLCWKLGEPSVGWWHTLAGGFEGRRPLDGADVLDPEAAGAARDA